MITHILTMQSCMCKALYYLLVMDLLLCLLQYSLLE